MHKLLYVAVGGAFGAVSRYLLGGLVNLRIGTSFPYGTFFINITGSFLLGVIMVLITDRFTLSPNVRLLIPIGFIGAYTTFSTFEYETVTLIMQGSTSTALVNIFASVIIGLIAVWLGIVVGRLF